MKLQKTLKEKSKLRKKLFKLNKQNEEWMSELEFMHDEQKFLEHLLSSHFLDLSTEKYYDSTKKLIQKLKDTEALGNNLFNSLEVHNKHLATLIETLQLQGKKDIKSEHQKINDDFNTYVRDLKYIKKKTFAMIKDIMRIQKQKLLISEV